ncbi:MAG: hypothetical protein ACJ8FY_09370 [Gemmataceae bacterium]
MLPRLYAITLIVLYGGPAATSFADNPAADCAPSCERTVDTTKVHLVPEQHAITVPSLNLREVRTTVPTMDLKIDFKEEKRTVVVTSLKPREEDRVVTSTTLVPETHIDPCTHCQTITYKPVCITKTVKVTVMDSVQETREVIVRVPILTPVQSSVVVKQLTVDVTTVPAVATTYRLVTIPGTASVPVPPRPILPPPCGQSGH